MKNFLHEGWMTLHNVASDLAAVDCDDESDAWHLVDLSQWCYFVLDIPACLGYRCEEGDIPSRPVRSHERNTSAGKALRDAGATLTASVPCESLPYRALQLGEKIYKDLCDEAKRDVGKRGNIAYSAATLYEAVKLEKTVSEMQRVLSSDLTTLPNIIKWREPVSILTAGAGEITSARQSGERSCIYRLIRGLTLVGIAIRKWKVKARCEYCFRIAAAGKKYCEVHSIDRQKTLKANAPKNQEVMHKRGRLAAEKLEACADPRWIEFCSRLFPTPRGVLSQFLFRHDGPEDWRTMLTDGSGSTGSAQHSEKFYWELLMREISNSEHVKQLFYQVKYTTLSARALLKECRIHLDAMDHSGSMAHWALKIRAAEIWLTTEVGIASKQRGRNHVTNERLGRAICLAKTGHSKKEIANALEIRPNLLSMWIKRYKKLADAFMHQPVHAAISQLGNSGS